MKLLKTTIGEEKMNYTELTNKKRKEFGNIQDYLAWYNENRSMLIEMEREEKVAKKKEIKAFANRGSYTDCEPFEVVKKISDKCVEIRMMDSKELEWEKEWVVGGFSGIMVNQNEQKWEITQNKNRPTFRIRFSNPKNGYITWKDKYGNQYSMNDRPIKFYDYNF